MSVNKFKTPHTHKHRNKYGKGLQEAATHLTLDGISTVRLIANDKLAAKQAIIMEALLVWNTALIGPHKKPAMIWPANTTVYITAQALPLTFSPLGHGFRSNLPDS